MTGLVNPREREIASLSHFAILNAIHDERLVASGVEFGLVRIVDVLRDSPANATSAKYFFHGNE